jgi:hypothetical protein
VELMCTLGRRTMYRATLFAALFSVSFLAQAQIDPCDLNGDGVVDDADVAFAVDWRLAQNRARRMSKVPAHAP